ncbi:MAG: SGNH/GDSL hydrolase family protein [Solirubrobacterales bacterium]
MKTVVCMGDSITHGFPYGEHVSWTRHLAERTGFQIINRGIDGNTTTDMCDRFQRHVLAQHPDYVIIMGGANDIVWRESHDRIVWNLREMIEAAQSQGIKVILGLPTPIDDLEMERRLDRVRGWIRDYAREHGLKIIDFYAALIDEQGLINEEMILDGAHPTETGYRRMFEAIPLDIFED